LFKSKIEWSVPIADIAGVDGTSDPFHGYILNKIDIKTRSKDRDFTFGFARSGTQEDAISRGNLDVAVEAVHITLNAPEA